MTSDLSSSPSMCDSTASSSAAISSNGSNGSSHSAPPTPSPDSIPPPPHSSSPSLNTPHIHPPSSHDESLVSNGSVPRPRGWRESKPRAIHSSKKPPSGHATPVITPMPVPIPMPVPQADVPSSVLPPAIHPYAHMTIRLSLGFRAIGHVIGRGGATIQSIRVRSGAQVEIDGTANVNGGTTSNPKETNSTNSTMTTNGGTATQFPPPARTVPEGPEHKNVRGVWIEGALRQVQHAIQLIIRALSERQVLKHAHALAMADGALAGLSLTPMLPSNASTPSQTPRSANSAATPHADGIHHPEDPEFIPCVTLTYVIPTTQLIAVLGTNSQQLRQTRTISGATLSLDPADVLKHDRALTITGSEGCVNLASEIVLGQLCQIQSSGMVPRMRRYDLTPSQLQHHSPKLPGGGASHHHETHHSEQFSEYLPPSAMPYDPLFAQLHAVSMQLQSLGFQAAHASMYAHHDPSQLHVIQMQIAQAQQFYMFLEAQLQFREQQMLWDMRHAPPSQQHPPAPSNRASNPSNPSNPPPPPSQQLLTIRASRPLSSLQSPSQPHRSPPLTLHIPASLVGALIGFRGENISYIRNESRAKIEIEPHSQQTNTTNTTASPSGTNTPAKRRLSDEEQKVSHEEAKQDHESKEAEEVAAALELEQPLNDTDSRVLVISGTNTQIEIAASLIARSLNLLLDVDHHHETSDTFIPPQQQPMLLPPPLPQQQSSRNPTPPSNSNPRTQSQPPQSQPQPQVERNVDQKVQKQKQQRGAGKQNKKQQQSKSIPAEDEVAAKEQAHDREQASDLRASVQNL